MRDEELQPILEDLFDAFPAGAGTQRIYAERLGRLGDAEILRTAVDWLIDNAMALPSISAVRVAYASYGGELGDQGRCMSPEQPGPVLSEEARAAAKQAGLRILAEHRAKRRA